MKCPKTHRIALLFDANQAFAREVIGGIAGYLSSGLVRALGNRLMPWRSVAS